MITQVLPYLQVILTTFNIVGLLYVFFKFLNKPQDTLSGEIKQINKELTELHLELKEYKRMLDASFDKHREQDKTNKVFKRVFILLANFEVAYCQETGYEHVDDLKEAKKELEGYLAGN